MENTLRDTNSVQATALPNAIERQSEQHKLIQLRCRRASEWRAAADRMEAAGQPGTALLFRNEAYRIEQESKL